MNWRHILTLVVHATWAAMAVIAMVQGAFILGLGLLCYVLGNLARDITLGERT